MTSDVLLGAFFTFLLIWLITAGIAAAIEARRALGIMGSYGPSDWVIGGISGLAASIVSATLMIIVQRILFFIGETILPLPVRTMLFTLLFILVCMSFTAIAYGFHRQAVEILALRRHWLYAQGLHLPAESLSVGVEVEDDGESP